MRLFQIHLPQVIIRLGGLPVYCIDMMQGTVVSIITGRKNTLLMLRQEETEVADLGRGNNLGILGQ
jgi:hypothetical protein